MTNLNEGRPPHPEYGPPLSGGPVTWGGVVFRPYSVGRGTNARISDDFRIRAQERSSWTMTYWVAVDGVALSGPSGKRKYFRTQQAAAEAGVKALKRKDAAQ
jgi:hypothetical protein